MFEIEQLQLSIGKQAIVKDLSLSLLPGELNVIIGPNGTGKTTLLRSLFGELSSDKGEIRYQGKRLSDQRLTHWQQHFGYMPQNTQLDLDLTVLEVVVLGRLASLGMRLNDEDLTAALSALADLGIVHLADRPVYSLSGGQRQLVLFAQVLLRTPKIMLLDEPVSALDLQHQMQLMEHLHQQTKANNWISVVVLHDLNLAAQFADKLIVLANQTLQAFGTPSEVLNSELIHTLYNVPVDIHHGSDGTPFIRTIRNNAGQLASMPH